ncbi:MAG: hypothetical protein J6W05_07165 [Prevotella sp.]|nr:hypothetical protein [Prevotella sp.]
MKGKDKEKNKKRDEEQWISPLINRLGEDITCLHGGEEPDFQLSFKEKLVGLEFTKLINKTEEEEYNEFKKYLNEYAVKVFDREKVKYNISENSFSRIKVWFDGILKPHIVNGSKVSKHKKEIFEELNQMIFHPDSLVKPGNYIERVKLEPLCKGNHSIVEILYVNPLQAVPLELLQERIHEKEEKLVNYKRLPRNSNISEYWLAIGLPEQYDIHAFELPKDFKTEYNRVYVLKNVFAEQVK